MDSQHISIPHAGILGAIASADIPRTPGDPSWAWKIQQYCFELDGHDGERAECPSTRLGIGCGGSTRTQID